MGAVLNLVVFPVSINVKPDVLDTRVWISPRQHRAQLCFPRLGGKSERPAFKELDAPRVKGVDFLVRVYDDGAQRELDRIHWGKPWKWSENQVLVASIQHVILRVPVDLPVTEQITSSVGEKFGDSFRDWFESFRDWVEISTGQDLDPRHPTSRSDSVGTMHAWVADAGSPRPYSYVQPPMTLRSGNEEASLNRTKLRRAVKAANSGEAPPEERLLIRDARAALRRRNYRGAVLDAATAVETIVTKQLEGRLSKVHSQLFVRELLKQTRAFPVRLALARRLGARLPDDLYNTVMRPRNETVHQNLAITRERAHAAVISASQVVSAHSRLPRIT